MFSYKELGLQNTKELFQKAVNGGYAIPAYNFNNLEQLQAIIQACVETRSPVILQVSKGARKYANQTLLRHLARRSSATRYRSCFISTMVTVSRCARTASTPAFRQS